jgi:hypothetical protein
MTFSRCGVDDIVRNLTIGTRWVPGVQSSTVTFPPVVRRACGLRRRSNCAAERFSAVDKPAVNLTRPIYVHGKRPVHECAAFRREFAMTTRRLTGREHDPGSSRPPTPVDGWCPPPRQPCVHGRLTPLLFFGQQRHDDAPGYVDHLAAVQADTIVHAADIDDGPSRAVAAVSGQRIEFDPGVTSIAVVPVGWLPAAGPRRWRRRRS